ncbi:DUF4129 domain-containing protein, partial [Chloroflexota bacterium]
LARSLDAKGWVVGAHRSFWSVFLLTGIGLILVMGIIISSVVTHDFLELVMLPIKSAVSIIWKGITFLMSLFPEPDLAELPASTPLPDTATIEAETLRELAHIPEWLRIWLNRGYVLLIGGLLLAGLWGLSSSVLNWLRLKLATTAGADIERLPSAFRQDFLTLLKHIYFFLLHLRFPFWLRRKLAVSPSETASVRQIYLQLLLWASKSGWPRHFSQTPYEYLYVLHDLLPQSQPELRILTEGYVRARYSSWLPTEGELQYLKDSWNQLRQNHLRAPDSESSRR